MKYGLILSLMVALNCWSQTTTGKAETTGACSPAISGNNNQVTIKCRGLTKRQADNYSALLNEILKRQIDPQTVMQELDEINAKIPRLSGMLLPANDSDPLPIPFCTAKSGDLKLVLGTVAWVNPIPGNILTVNNLNKIAVHRLGSGIGVDADLTSEDGKISVQIRDNRFVVNPNNTFNVTGDQSTLIVHNDRGVEVLNVRFSNETTVRINAIFYPGPPGVRLEVNERGLKAIGVEDGGLSVDNSCFFRRPGMVVDFEMRDGHPVVLTSF